MTLPKAFRAITLQVAATTDKRGYWTGVDGNTTQTAVGAKLYGPHDNPQDDWHRLDVEGRDPKLVKVIENTIKKTLSVVMLAG